MFLIRKYSVSIRKIEKEFYYFLFKYINTANAKNAKGEKKKYKIHVYV